ncbi:SCP1.201-like deaminase [Amycolatopsis sp. QT-25]|uniref:DddA-like double-stranded DNA deaminase toxin n=1 Tax=Amycolatopsis sp. QT-25 TaxID=3034022 RepID=UPI0023EE0BF7|nr:DddA-like double-stranded DNA deaminase toxin [Amycolatopsis sp. QT-25]WET78192.1 SCP1.201-like deaminase [Amycolatopsis sp. QT-25]
MGTDELAANVHAALAKLPDGHLTDAASLADEARQALVSTGSRQPEIQQAASIYGQVSESIGAVRAIIERAGGLLGGYLSTLGVPYTPAAGPRTAAGGATANPPTPTPVPSTPDGQRLTREQAEALQAEMPPPVVSNTGTKTHGRWIDEHGIAHPIISGRDADADTAARLLRDHGIPPDGRGELATTADIEQKLAARMVSEGRKHLDVTLNNRPCKGPYGCDTLVPIILPEGYTMTVHAPKYRKTFTGGATPWSR